MKVGYFPGCSLHATSREFDESVRGIAPALDFQLEEVSDWACCGATSGHATNHLLSVALPARTLAMAESQKLESVMAPCAACYSRLATARHAMTESPDLASHVTAILGRPFDNSVAVLSIVELLHGAVGAIKEKAKVPLQGLKVACYYGCLLMRPPNVTRCDDAEAPTSMEAVVGATGATAVKWNMALECCGGGFSLSRTASVVRLSRAILEDAKRAGAEAIVVACPMCHSNLDFRQRAIEKRGGATLSLPILFLSQLVGLSFGLDPDFLGLARHFVSPRPFLDRITQTQALPEQREQA